jgi:hypothetical protein
MVLKRVVVSRIGEPLLVIVFFFFFFFLTEGMYYGTRGAKNVMYRYSYTGGLFVVGDRSRSYQYNVIYEAMCDA